MCRVSSGLGGVSGTGLGVEALEVSEWAEGLVRGWERDGGGAQVPVMDWMPSWALEDRLSELKDEMSSLKTSLYGRFGRSINLEGKRG